jgi:membrane protease subunit HflK
MSILTGLGVRALGLFADNKGPWGSSGSGGSGEGQEPPASGEAGPWAEAPKRSRRPTLPGGGNVASFDEFVKRGRAKFGGSGGGGGLPSQPSRSMIMWAVAGAVLLWLIFSMAHVVAAEQRGVVTRLGAYSRTLSPGFQLTMPWPFERLQKVDVDKIQEFQIGSAQEETLMLTGDQNIIDIAYQVRWKVRDPEKYLFALAEPNETIREVAEAAMRAVIANVSLTGAMGEQRGIIESRVAEEMQETLNGYGSGLAIQGVSLREADPPAAVNEAFKAVTAAQQASQSDINQANAYALQMRQVAEGEATAFNKVFEQYKLAPDVTRRRLYYETMERVLRNVDKTIIEAPGVTPYLPLNQMGRTPPAAPRGAGQ